MRIRKTVEKRIAQEKRELSLAVILSLTVLMFLLTHTPRLQTEIKTNTNARSGKFLTQNLI